MTFTSLRGKTLGWIKFKIQQKVKRDTQLMISCIY